MIILNLFNKFSNLKPVKINSQKIILANLYYLNQKYGFSIGLFVLINLYQIYLEYKPYPLHPSIPLHSDWIQ